MALATSFGALTIASFGVRLFPKLSGNLQCVDFEALPPSDFIARLVKLPMMAAAERDRELVAHLHADGARLSKSQMVRIRRLPPANEAGLHGDELEMLLVAQPLGLSDGEDAFVDVAGQYIGLRGRQGAALLASALVAVARR